MLLRYMGKETQGGGSPTLYETDIEIQGKPQIVVQGWELTPELREALNIPEGENAVLVPKALMRHLPVDDEAYGLTAR